MTGRPTDYNPTIASRICNEMANGMSLATICKPDGMPCRGTVWNWSKRHSRFFDLLMQAREAHADMIADEVVDIADNEPDPQKARNRIEARKWKAGVIKPKVYGPRVDVNITETINFDTARSRAIARLQQSRADPAVLPSVQVVSVEGTDALDSADVFDSVDSIDSIDSIASIEDLEGRTLDSPPPGGQPVTLADLLGD